MKSLVLVAAGTPVLALVRGDHQLSEAKLAAAVGALAVRPAHADEIRAWFGAGAGSLGPVGIADMGVLADEALRGRRNMIAGANRDDYHLRHVTPGEDFHAEFFDLRRVEQGDSCQRCGTALEFRKAFEIGHLRNLCASSDLHVTNEASEEVPLRMGAYGIQFERILRAAIELGHDKDGIVMPASIAPFDVVITPVDIRNAAQREAAESLHAECLRVGLDTLYDDRDERPGVKFKDADLIGVPYRVTVGKRKFEQGLAEIFQRSTKQIQDAKLEMVVSNLLALQRG
jgi:prolyl-tRNA synthetase